MNNKKILKTTEENKNTENLSLEQLEKNLFDMIWPYEKLKLDIAELDKLENPPVVKLASFLFKVQLVEFELRGLLSFFDKILEVENKSLPVYRKLSGKNQEKRRNSTLGQLKDELGNYNGSIIDKLISKLELLNKKRNVFTHHLFSQNTTIEDLAKESNQYKSYATHSLKLIEKIRKDTIDILLKRR